MVCSIVQFALQRITADKTMYFCVLAALDQDTATRLLDIINKYKTLKEQLLGTYGLSVRERAAGPLVDESGVGTPLSSTRGLQTIGVNG